MLAPSKPDTVATQERERLRAKQLKDKPYKADENKLKTFRQLAQEVERKDALKTQRPANELFEKAVDYKTYRIANRSASYTPYMAGHLLRSKKKSTQVCLKILGPAKTVSASSTCWTASDALATTADSTKASA